MIRRLVALGLLVACLWLSGHASTVEAQQRVGPPRIGVLLASESKYAQKFRQGLEGAGYAEGRDVVIEWRAESGDYAGLPELAADLVQRKVEVIVAAGTVVAQAVKRATSTIPIVIVNVADPVGSGLVTDLAHPGGNVTGFSNMLAELSVKRMQLLKEAMPQVARVAVLWNPDTPWHTKVIGDLKAATPSLSIELSFASVRTPGEFRPAFLAAKHTHARALYVLDAPLFLFHRAMLVNLASEAQLPAIYGAREYPEKGGLMSYGANYLDLFYRAAGYVVKILRGTKAGDLPVEQPTKFELVVNLKTANALRLTIPESVLVRADEVIR